MVYAYLRVSTGKQDGRNQRIGVEALATARGLHIDEYIHTRNTQNQYHHYRHIYPSLHIVRAIPNPGLQIPSAEYQCDHNQILPY